jgi:hypothetical protein
MKPVPYKTFELIVSKKVKGDDIVLHEGKYSDRNSAIKIAQQFLGFKLNRSELKSLQEYHNVYKYHSKRMGAFSVRLNEEYKCPLGCVYFHINNGGVVFEVFDKGAYGPEFKISASHFGHKTNNIELLTDPESMRKLGEMLISASKHNFSGTYCCVTRAENAEDRMKRHKQKEIADGKCETIEKVAKKK